MTRHTVLRSNGQPANATRPRGYVTEAMCQRYGSYARALEALNKAGGDMQRVMARDAA
jgi:hypothetical protein